MNSFIKISKVLVLYVAGFILGAFGGQQLYYSFLYQRPTGMPTDLMDFGAAMDSAFAMFFGGILGIVAILTLRILLNLLNKK